MIPVPWLSSPFDRVIIVPTTTITVRPILITRGLFPVKIVFNLELIIV